MRTHGDRVRAVHERGDLTLDERRQRAAAIKARAHAEHPDLPSLWADGDLTITVDHVEYDEKRNLLRVWPFAARGATALVLNAPYEYVNPPLARHAEDGSVLEDVPAAFREMVTQTVRSQV